MLSTVNAKLAAMVWLEPALDSVRVDNYHLCTAAQYICPCICGFHSCQCPASDEILFVRANAIISADVGWTLAWLSEWVV